MNSVLNWDTFLSYTYCSGAGAAPSTCALSGRRRRSLENVIDDQPINGIYYRPDNLMTEEDKNLYLKSIKVSKASSEEDVLARNERDTQVINNNGIF